MENVVRLILLWSLVFTASVSCKPRSEESEVKEFDLGDDDGVVTKVEFSKLEGSIEAIGKQRAQFEKRLNAIIGAPNNAFSSKRPVFDDADRSKLRPADKGGRWETVDQKVRMQAIHMVAVPAEPDGNDQPTKIKVLVVNGSSNRDGLQSGNDLNLVSEVDNTGLFDPTLGPHGLLEKVAPIPASLGKVGDKVQDIDMFCGNHLQTFKGDVLFAGGSKRYLDNGRFEGISTLWLWNWRKNAFEGTGKKLRNGRWYPTIIPDGYGRLIIVSGISQTADQISRVIESYDPLTDALQSWPPQGGNNFDAINRSFQTMGGMWDMYPRLIPHQDGRYLLDGDGSGYGNRGNQNTQYLTFSPPGPNFKVTITDGPRRPSANRFYPTSLFDPRPGKETQFLTLGGQIFSDDLKQKQGQGGTADLIRYVPGNGQENGTFYNRSMQAFGNQPYLNNEEDFLGGEGIQRNGDASFAGGNNLDRRINHVALYLPTGDFMVVGGGNYGYVEPNFFPMLYRAARDPADTTALAGDPDELTPGQLGECDFGVRVPGRQSPKVRNGFCRLVMNPHRFARFYHTSAVLLPDGSVFLGGGNVQRAAISNNGTKILELDTSPGYTSEANPAEQHFFERFYPPYYDAANRPAIQSRATQKVKYGQKLDLTVNNSSQKFKVTMIKLNSVTHGMDIGERLANLQTTGGGNKITATVPQVGMRHIYPPGYYMVFYVDVDRMVPSEAKLVQLMPDRS